MTRATRLLSGLILIWISGVAGEVADVPADKSLAVSYGPSDQIMLFLNWKAFGFYTQPIISSDSRSDVTGTREIKELGARNGLFFGYTALNYRKFECRLLVGAGGQYVQREETLESGFGGAYHQENRQYVGEIWMQPEFRFFSRFAIILQAQALRVVRETDESDSESTRVNFDTPDLSLSDLRVGFRYYFPIHF